MTETKINISAPKVIIKKPRVTEKSAIASEKGVYVFEISKAANKSEVKKEIERIYSTKVEKVNIAKTASKKTFIRGKKGTKAGIKKAYVYLKKGEKALEIF
ncbi:MAG TPA: 50S ribosomal protein L23 [Candidatus Pacebacteria bacterium]|nr:50S ribosomal protein L23 [Candidatus Paceibacterota bacterium]HIP33894.1 50S ribosomal protein L23 [Bacteroidia bacterium]